MKHRVLNAEELEILNYGFKSGILCGIGLSLAASVPIALYQDVRSRRTPKTK